MVSKNGCINVSHLTSFLQCDFIISLLKRWSLFSVVLNRGWLRDLLRPIQYDRSDIGLMASV